MNFWSILGIEPTQDIKAIKKAYSQKLKGLDRAHDIEGFQTLHEAYQKALAAAENPKVNYHDIEHCPRPNHDAPAPIQEETPGPLAAALDVFFESLKSAENREDFEGPYQTLRTQWALARDLLRTNLLESFLLRLHDVLSVNPVLAHPAVLHNLFRELGLEDDVTLYQQYDQLIDRIWGLANYERQKEVWLHRVDHKTAAILLDSELRAGYAERRELKVLSNIMNAITLIETEFPLLVGRFVSFEKIRFWKELQRSWLITHDDLLLAFSGFLIVPALKAALFFHPISQGMNDTMLIISHPLALLYLLLTRKLRSRIQEGLDEGTAAKRLWSLRNNGRLVLTLLILNGAWAVLSLAGQLYASTHAVALLGLISLFLVIPMPFVVIGAATILGSVLLALLLPSDQTMDLVLAAQLGTPLLFFLVRIPGFFRALHKKIRPNAPPRPLRPTRRPLNFLTIVVAITLVRILAWIASHLF